MKRLPLNRIEHKCKYCGNNNIIDIDETKKTNFCKLKNNSEIFYIDIKCENCNEKNYMEVLKLKNNNIENCFFNIDSVIENRVQFVVKKENFIYFYANIVESYIYEELDLYNCQNIMRILKSNKLNKRLNEIIEIEINNFIKEERKFERDIDFIKYIKEVFELYLIKKSDEINKSKLINYIQTNILEIKINKLITTKIKSQLENDFIKFILSDGEYIKDKTINPHVYACFRINKNAFINKFVNKYIEQAINKDELISRAFKLKTNSIELHLIIKEI